MRRMMVDMPIPPKWKELWNTWDLRGFIILSLSLQTFLIFFAPLRKRFRSYWVMVPLWSAYLLADWAANFAVGLISNSQANPSGDFDKKVRIAVENEDLLAFWAPFLLVHLGGPDTITAFALEDNELWLRHFLGLVFQCLAAVYVFVQSLPRNRLWIPTMLMFMTGIIKYAERTWSLYRASADRFKVSALKEKRMDENQSKDEHQSKEEEKLPTISTKNGNLTELEVVQYGYRFFEKFKGLVVDMKFSQRDRKQSRDFFLKRNANDAFRVVEVELNFIYEVLFTKRPLVFSKTLVGKIIGVICRVFSLAAVCSAIVLFIFKNKSHFTAADVSITYGLLFGALVLDMTALIMLLFSDWTVIHICKSPDVGLEKSFKTRLVTNILKYKPRRWSECISNYNLMYHSLHPPRKLISFCYEHCLSDYPIFYNEVENFNTKLRDFIFEELKSKSERGGKLETAEELETAKQISSARGEWVLRDKEDWNSLLDYVLKFDYDQSLILWHVATELCYNEDLSNNVYSNKRDISKLLSEYMLYLLMWHVATELCYHERTTSHPQRCGLVVHPITSRGRTEHGGVASSLI